MRNEINLKSYERNANIYGRDTRLHNSESYILAKYAGDVVGKRVLDIGVGVGRTTPVVSTLAGSYIAADYSAQMIQTFRSKFPGVKCLQADARKLDFPDGSFDFVLFAFNGIDSVVHEDRILILREINRVLTPKGLFVFSSHNRDVVQAGWPKKGFPKNPLKWKLALAQKKAQSANRARLKPLEIETEEYALLNDPAHDYGMLVYYISRNSQQKQLERTGFNLIETVDWEHLWINYVAHRAS
jgi:ubiquinone/menaquinone biosynthesis C-methylase UbiE